jgi:hypothetical protein
MRKEEPRKKEGLRVSPLKSKWPKIVLYVVLAILLGCIIRVAVWEHFYYKEKEGSERHIPEVLPNLEEAEVDEE